MGSRLEGLLSAATVFGLLLTGGPAVAANSENGQEASRLDLAVSNADADAKLIAISLSTHAQLNVEDMDLELLWAGLRESPISLLREQKADLALIDLGDAALTELSEDDELRSVMKLWLRGGSEDDADDQGKLLLADPSVRPDTVELLLASLFGNDHKITLTRIDKNRLDPSVAIDSGLPIARHAGVDNYLEAMDLPSPSDEESATEVAAVSNTEAHQPELKPTVEVSEPEPKPKPTVEARPAHSPIPRPPGIVNGRSFTLYFNSDEAKLTKDDFKAVAAACNYAATLPRARFVIAGHTDTVGSKTYNKALAENRASSVAEAIRNDPRFREALSVMEYGELKLAVPTDDETAEPLNRRVDITVFVDEEG